MRMPVQLFVAFVFAIILSLMAPPTLANTLYVGSSSAASDANNCFSPTAPCSTFQHAHDQAAAGDEIRCITPFQTVFQLSISKTIEIDCAGSFYENAGTMIGIGGPGIVVKIRNMSFNGGITGGAGFPGIVFSNGAELLIDNCTIHNFQNIAIKFAPSAPGSQLVISNSLISNNGTSPSTGGGLQVAPTSGGSASVRLERVSFDFNVTSLVLSGPVNATMIGSVVQASRSNGILVGSGSTLVIEDSKLLYNVGSAVSVTSGGTVRLSNDTIESNQIGISNSGGHAFTYSNNAIFGNGSTAALTPIQRNQ